MAVLSSPLKGESLKRAGAFFEPLKVSAQDAPNMTVQINAGGFWVNETTYVEYSGGTSPLITAPVANAKWVFVTLQADGSVSLIDGGESTNPLQPTVPEDGRLVLAACYVNVATNIITSGMISDIRPLFSVGSYAQSHVDVVNRNHVDAHDITSITNLQTELDDRPLALTLTNGLALKAEATGTNETSFTLNADEVGVPSADVQLIVERGTESNVGIRWNETDNQWQFTNDGAAWVAFDATANDFYSQTALDGGALNILYYTETEIDVALALKSDAGHTHTATYEPINVNIQAHIIDTANPHAITKAQVGLTSVDDTSDAAKPVSTATQTALDLKADTGHTHTAAYEPINANIQAHIIDTANPHTVTKAQVGLTSVDDTADADKPVSTAAQTAIDLKADLASPVFTGVPILPSILFASLPVATAGGAIYCSDASAGAGAMCFGNGINWIDTVTGVIVVA